DEPGNEHEQGALAAPRRTHDRDEFAAGDRKVHLRQRANLGPARRLVGLADTGNHDRSAAREPPLVVDRARSQPYSASCVATRFHGRATRSMKATALKSSTPSSDRTTTAANSNGVSRRTCEISCR